ENNAQIFYGLSTVREALAHSHNVTATYAYKSILDENPAKNYISKLGVNTKDHENNPSLALGAIEAEAYKWVNGFATLGNHGQYNEPYIIEKITDSDGNTVYEHEDKKPKEIYSPQSAYL